MLQDNPIMSLGLNMTDQGAFIRVGHYNEAYKLHQDRDICDEHGQEALDR